MQFGRCEITNLFPVEYHSYRLTRTLQLGLGVIFTFLNRCLWYSFIMHTKEHSLLSAFFLYVDHTVVSNAITIHHSSKSNFKKRGANSLLCLFGRKEEALMHSFVRQVPHPLLMGYNLKIHQENNITTTNT